jgi:hypothetical protein
VAGLVIVDGTTVAVMPPRLGAVRASFETAACSPGSGCTGPWSAYWWSRAWGRPLPAGDRAVLVPRCLLGTNWPAEAREIRGSARRSSCRGAGSRRTIDAARIRSELNNARVDAIHRPSGRPAQGGRLITELVQLTVEGSPDTRDRWRPPWRRRAETATALHRRP